MLDWSAGMEYWNGITGMESLEWNHWNGVKHWSGPVSILGKVLGIYL